jgi:phosphate transport system substrate-binding protein
MKLSIYSLILITLGSVVSCNLAKKERVAVVQEVTMAADESLKPMIDEVYKAYEAVFEGSKFSVAYKPEQEVVKMLLEAKTSLVFTTRELTNNEAQQLLNEGIRYHPQPIATDGVALLVSRSNIDTLISVPELKEIFEGKITDWSQLKKRTRTGKIVLVFDNANASNINYMMRKFELNEVKKLNVFAAGSNPKVIDYVRQNPNAIGFIGVNWISDGEQPLTAELSKGLRVMGVAEHSDSTYYQPFQNDLRFRTYPLRRKVYAITRGANTELGGKLLNYIMRDVGSLVIEKCGLWPQKPYKREIIIQKEL